MWTLFWDMHSGGGTKEPPYEKIYIEAPRKEAEIVFYNRFGHSAGRVTCTCCGEDYSVSESETLEQASGFHRNCYSMARKEYDSDNGGWDHKYVEADKPLNTMKVPEGYKIEKAGWGSQDYQTVEKYSAREDVLIIPASDIKPHERIGDVPTEGYIWV